MDDTSYFERRYCQEMAAVQSSSCPAARAAHQEMARCYASRLLSCSATTPAVREAAAAKRA
jgi:hypothetical protein